MVGWLLALILPWSEAPWALRLPATLAPVLAALAVRAALRSRDPEAADWAALCVLLLPASVWNVLITPDAPLLFFATGSVLLFARGVFLGAGVLLGLAFLSKYFAVLLFAAYFAWALASHAPGRWRGLGLAALGALPFALINLAWNWQACWCNLMFNLVNRHEDAGWSAARPALYVATLAYAAGPLLWFAWRGRERLAASGALLAAWALPLAAFAALSAWTRIGLHWPLAFLPALAASLAVALGRDALARSARWFALFALAHAALAAAIAALPLERWSAQRFYPGLVQLAKPQELLRGIGPEMSGFELAAGSYSSAALLAYHARRDVPVFGAGSSHARQDDFRTDWRRRDGADLLVLRRDPPREDDFRPYFRSLELREFEVRGARFHAVLGRGFDFAAYRRGVLEVVRARYYAIPAWLPAGRCLFCERYFGGATCGR